MKLWSFRKRKQAEERQERMESSTESQVVESRLKPQESREQAEVEAPIVLAKPPPAPTAYLKGKKISGESVYVALVRSPLIFGRDVDGDVDLVIDETFADAQTISPRHARIEKWDGRWVIVDLQSQQGVFVNGKRTGENVLKDGFTVSLGKVEFVFRQNAG